MSVFDGSWLSVGRLRQRWVDVDDVGYEQRIGRCHRFCRKHDVIVINFLNRLNAADQRVLELLSEKLRLFDGVFGSSDEILGRIESGVDFERRIAAIYDTCRTPEEIDSAFATLRAELEESIDKRMRETEAKLLENFDGQILDRLRVHRDQAVQQLDRISELFWRLSRYLLQARANFDDQQLQFELLDSPCAGAAAGKYQLIRKGQPLSETAHTYRLTHPLGEHVLDAGRRVEAPTTELVFDLSSSAHKISVLENLGSPRGWLELNLLELESFQLEEHLVFTAQVDDGTWLDSEACEQMMDLPAVVHSLSGEAPAADFDANVRRQIEATLSRALEEKNEYFQREREKLEAWAEDQIHSAEQALHDTKDRIKDAKRRARAAVSVDEQAVIQNELKGLERTQRTQRQQIFDVEDEIEAKRDELIAALQRRLNQQSRSMPLFRIRWCLV